MSLEKNFKNKLYDIFFGGERRINLSKSEKIVQSVFLTIFFPILLPTFYIGRLYNSETIKRAEAKKIYSFQIRNEYSDRRNNLFKLLKVKEKKLEKEELYSVQIKVIKKSLVKKFIIEKNKSRYDELTKEEINELNKLLDQIQTEKIKEFHEHYNKYFSDDEKDIPNKKGETEIKIHRLEKIKAYYSHKLINKKKYFETGKKGIKEVSQKNKWLFIEDISNLTTKDIFFKRFFPSFILSTIIITTFTFFKKNKADIIKNIDKIIKLFLIISLVTLATYLLIQLTAYTLTRERRKLAKELDVSTKTVEVITEEIEKIDEEIKIEKLYK